MAYIEGMGPLLYSLCQKPLLGWAMASAALCDFPPLMKDVSLELAAAGAMVTAEVQVPVDLSYALRLELRKPDGRALSRQEVSIVGDRRVEDCGDGADLDKVPRHERAGFGRPMAFRVEVRRKPDNMLVHSRLVNTICVAGKWASQRSRSLGNIALVRGTYTVRIQNIDAQAGLEGLNATLALAPATRPLNARR